MTKKWANYEEVARDLLDRFSTEFGLDRFEGKQKVSGNRSSTEWEIDAKGVRDSDGGFMIVECRRYTTSRQPQEKVGALAYRIMDCGAEGGIYVSPLGLQEGAKKVAAAENIVEVLLTADSTQMDYMMTFLKTIAAGVSQRLDLQQKVEVVVDRSKRREH